MSIEKISENRARITFNSSGEATITASCGDKRVKCNSTCLLPIPYLTSGTLRGQTQYTVGEVGEFYVQDNYDRNVNKEYRESTYYSLEVTSDNPACVRMDRNRIDEGYRNKFQFTCLSTVTATITARWGSQTAKQFTTVDN